MLHISCVQVDILDPHILDPKSIPLLRIKFRPWPRWCKEATLRQVRVFIIVIVMPTITSVVFIVVVVLHLSILIAISLTAFIVALYYYSRHYSGSIMNRILLVLRILTLLLLLALSLLSLECYCIM